jgi:thiosulfate/3-mercaptopyruvate sulfurtransferase
MRKSGCKDKKEKEITIMRGIPQVRKNLILFSLMVTVIFNLLLNGSVYALNLGLIEPAALNQNASAWVILDARPKTEWLAGHLPGALSFSWENYTRTDENGIPYRVWSPRELSAELGKMGINENTPIVVYGDADKSWGGEGWNCWVLSWLGHKGPIRLLGGGIQAWRKNKLPINEGIEHKTLRPVPYKFKLEPNVDISTTELERQKSNLVLIDTRSTLEWFKGRIPGAIHIPWDNFFSGKERRPLPPDALKKLLQKHGVDINKPIVYYCTGGIRSAYAWSVHQLSGFPTARNYEGGFEAWKRVSQK